MFTQESCQRTRKFRAYVLVPIDQFGTHSTAAAGGEVNVSEGRNLGKGNLRSILSVVHQWVSGSNFYSTKQLHHGRATTQSLRRPYPNNLRCIKLASDGGGGHAGRQAKENLQLEKQAEWCKEG